MTPATLVRASRALLAPLAALALGAAAFAAGPPAAPLHRYRLVLLLSGDRPPIPEAVAESLQAGHMANIQAMFRGGALEAAGPMGDDSPLIGIFVFGDEHANLDSLLAADPVLHAGRLRPVAYTWTAPHVLSDEYRRAKAAGAADSMVAWTFVLMRGPDPARAETAGPDAAWSARARRDGALRLGGPLEGRGPLRTLMIFATDSAATAARLASEPGVASGRWTPEIHQWWTAAGVVPSN
jgi:hypothetical protein